MSDLRKAAQQALKAMGCAVPTGKITLYEWDRAISDLSAALSQQPEPTRSQQMADAGFKPRDRRLECDECGGKFTAQMLPIHKCAQQPDPAREWASIPGTNVRVPVQRRPHDAGSHDQQMTPAMQRVVDAADKRAKEQPEPVQEPLTDDEIMALWERHIGPISFARAVERKVRGEA